MSGPGIGRGLNVSTRTVRKIEPPRPLKTTPTNETRSKSSLSSLVLPAKAIDSAEKLLLFMDAVVTGIVSDDELSLKPENKALLTANIISLCENLKIYGPQLENSMYQGQLDRAFMTFREGMVRNNLELEARVHLLDILELRECRWSTRKTPKPFTIKNSLQSLDDELPFAKLQPLSPTQAESTTHLGADEIIKSSGKYRDKQTKPSKNYCKEEIIIRNSDSGKVMGIKGRRVHMIEQLSETIISFQKVQPTFKERLVQITGPSEENISYATQLIEETIRNNSSPVRELGESDSSYSSDESYEKAAGHEDNSLADNFTAANSSCNYGYQFKHKVSYNDSVLTLTGNDYYFVTLAKSVLDDYFSKLTQEEYYNFYSNGNTSTNETAIWENDAVFADNSTATIDLTSDNVDIYGAGDAEEDNILKQLHHDLNNINLQPSSPTKSVVSFSDSIDEEPIVDDKPADSDHSKIVYTKEFLLECRKKSICNQEPENWQRVKNQFPNLVKASIYPFPDIKAPTSDTLSSAENATNENTKNET